MTEPTFAATVTRPDDLLAVTFEGINLRLDTAEGQPARLVRVATGEPAFLVVRLAPQHVAEQARPDAGPVPLAVAAGPSRLAFRLADDATSLDLTLPGLLDWGGHTPSIPANAVAAAPSDLPTLAPAEPGPAETAIELPYRLVLSPDESAGWTHPTAPVTHGGVTELWQTRLGVRGPLGVDETQVPGLRAVWSRDLRPGDIGLAGTSLDGDTRAAIVVLSSFFGEEILLLNPMRDPLYYVPPALLATHLALSALGGWTDLRGDWDFPEDPSEIYPNQAVPGGASPQYKVTAWRHVVAQGRDQYVRVVQRGFLYPLGHRADRIDVYERRLDPGDGADPLVHIESTVVVRERMRDYASLSGEHPLDHALPLRRARIETMATPPQDGAGNGSAFLVSGADGAPLPFHVVADDWAERSVDLHMPLVFALDVADPTLGVVYHEGVRTVDLGGQPVALARGEPAATTLPVWQFTFAEAVGPLILPSVAQAQVSVPAVDHLVGSSAPNVIRTAVTLADPGMGPAEVFAQLSEPLPVDLPARLAGGLARPSLAVGALSLSRGAVPAGLEDLATVKDRLFHDLAAARLFGTVELQHLIGAITGLDQLPQVRRQEDATGTVVSFTWTPPLQGGPSTEPLELHDGAVLSLTTTLRAPVGGGPPQSEVRGTLTNFALNFLDIVEVTFEAIEFHAEQGKQLEVRPRGVQLHLQKELAFLNALADILPRTGFSDGPTLAVTPQGVTAGYALGLPGIGLGIFSLEHVGLSAALTLPFDASPASVRLAFSERAHPFLVTISMIGGSGFFALEVDTQGVRRIEGALEVGANITVDLAIVSANVHVMAGFYFSLTRVDGRDSIDFSAYLRIGGSVELLGIAGVSIDISLALSLRAGGRSIGGEAAVVVSVHLLMFRKALTLHTSKDFPIAANDPTFEDLVAEDDWETYCRAFA